MTTVEPVADERRRRPRHRKQQILNAARELFVARGYPNVSMAAIAEQVGITASALYRHVANKAVLLEQVFEDSFAWLDSPVAPADYDRTVEQVMALVVGRPYLSDLWTREMRHLTQEMRRELRRSMRAWNAGLVPGLRSQCPGLDEGQLELMLWSVQSMIASVSRQSLRSPGAERIPAIEDALRALTSAPLVTTGPVLERTPPSRLPASMRERLLIAAFEQFGQYGYQGTSLARIGAAVDVSGTNVYGYYENKEDVLRAVFERGSHALWLALERTLASSTDAEEALTRLARSYVGMARYWASSVEDAYTSLDADLVESVRSFRREYIAEWTALLVQARPDRGARRAYLQVRLGLFLVGDLYSNTSLTRVATFSRNVEALLLAVLLDPARAAPADEADDRRGGHGG